MKNSNFKRNTLLICSFLALAGVPEMTFAIDYVQNPYENIDYYDVGMSNLQNRKYTEAIDSFKKALSKDPKHTSARNNLAVAYTSRGNYFYNQGINLENAANDYRSAIYYLKYYDKSSNTNTMNENIDIVLKNFDSVLLSQKFSTAPQNRLKKAKELRGKGEFEASVIEYINAATDRSCAYESYIALGDVFKTLSNEYNAALYYDKALAINSNDPNLHLKFGRSLYNFGKVDAAVKELDIASENPKTKNEALALLETIWKKKVAQNPKDAIAQMNLGAVYQNKKEYEMAMIQYKNAQSLSPFNQTLQLNIATLMQEKGNYAEALNLYNTILKSNPNNITVNIYKASTLDKMGKKDEAIAIYNRLLQNNPSDINVKDALLDTISTIPDASALNYLSKLAEKMPNDADVIYTYAYTLHKNRNYSEALVNYQKALVIDNKNLDAYLNIATIYKQENDIMKAIETLKTAKTVYPKNDKIAQMLSEYDADIEFSLIEKATKLYNKKDYNDAIIVYKSIQKPSEDVYLGIGACYQAMERYDDAISNY
ncbi:MAG: tetratricopeptide repeat protein, partial [Candidatus Gastranaerophilales bacterium]|nr:tetratricopeptide repeat protein [Candidatus Gastranaerophilales bacterium]